MKVRVLAFAGVREILGSGEIEVELPEDGSLDDLRRLLDRRHPELARYWDRLAIAVDGQLGDGDPALADGAEIALLPPVSGGMDEPAPEPRVALVDGPIDIDQASSAVTRDSAGAVVIFLGTVRDDHDGRRVTRLTYDAYRPMALEALARIAQDLETDDPALAVGITHRLGEVPAGEASVVIAVSAPHRAAAYDASRKALERLKREVPIWKLEQFADGDQAWREEEPLERRSAASRSPAGA
jgi:molybdopterin synthase catalytic subunit/molybdopterin converting factor small subunit